MAYRFHRWVLYLNQMNSWICVLFTRIAFNRERERERKKRVFPSTISMFPLSRPPTHNNLLLYSHCLFGVPHLFFYFISTPPQTSGPPQGESWRTRNSTKRAPAFFFLLWRGMFFFHCFQLWMERNFYRITFFFILVFIRSRNNKNSFLFAVSWDGKS